MRVFILGLPKTGLSSTLLACEKLGLKRFIYRTKNPLEAIEQHDNMAIGDLRFLAVWRTAVERWTDAKLILTEREKEAWLTSVCRWFDRKNPGEGGRALRRKVLGTDTGDRDTLWAAYTRHVDEVSRLDVLRFRPTEGDGWEPLCAFLGVPVPEEPFPHRNRWGVK